MRLIATVVLACSSLIGHAARVGQAETVDFGEHQTAARHLLHHVAFERVVEREFGDLEAEEFAKIFERHLGEGEVVALEILRDGEAERGRRIAAERVEDLDPDVGVAVRLRPIARAGVQRVRA